MLDNFFVNIVKEARRYEQAVEDFDLLCDLWSVPVEKKQSIFTTTKDCLEHVVENCYSPKNIFDEVKQFSGIYDRNYATTFENTEQLYALRMRHHMSQVIMDLAAQAVSARYMIDVIANWDGKEEARKEALLRASSKFHYNHTSNRFGWGWNVWMNEELPVGYKEEGEPKSPSRYQNYGKSIHVGIDPNWGENVEAKGLQTVELSGNKSAMVLSLEEIPEHELLAEDVKLFKAKICYTYCPMKERIEQVDKVIIEDKVIAAQYNSSGRPEIVATGKDQSWAVRTMKGRLKKDLFAQLDI